MWACGVMAALCLVPGLPKLAFFGVAVALGWAGRRIQPELAAASGAAEKDRKAADKSQIENLGPPFLRWKI